MSTTKQHRLNKTQADTLQQIAGGQLPKWTWLAVVVVTVAVIAAILHLTMSGKENYEFPFALTFALTLPIFLIIMAVLSWVIEGGRRAKDRFAKYLVTSFFLIAVIPLASLIYEVTSRGLNRFDMAFFTTDQSQFFDMTVPVGALHAIIGSLVTTGIATLISVPVGILTAIYLVEYGKNGKLAFAIRFFVDVMTGIPSIVAGLFAFAMISLLFAATSQSKMGLGGSIALTVLMIPTIVRSTEEMLKLVPNELREASYALGVPKWRTIVRVVLPTSLAGIITGVVLGVARIIGETAPLLVAAGWFTNINWNPTQGSMATLPVYVYQSLRDVSNRSEEMAQVGWTGALVLILSVMLLNLIGRIIAWKFAPKPGR